MPGFTHPKTSVVVLRRPKMPLTALFRRDTLRVLQTLLGVAMTTKRITRRVRATDKEDATLPLPLHFRVRPDTMKALKEAQAISGRTLSGECEAQLNRALVETNVALWPLMQLLSDILGKIPEFSKATRWADNYVLFDRAFNAITTMLEMLRPPGPIRQDATDDEKQQWRNLVLNSLFQIG